MNTRSVGVTKSIDGIRPNQSSSNPRVKRVSLKKLVVGRQKVILFTLLGIIGVVCVVGWIVLRQTNSLDAGDLESVESRISKHYLLPTNERPALATVTDKTKLNTPFLKNAENGDRVLIYQNNHLAIIYRPSIDRIINVGPVSIDAPPNSAQ